MNILINKLCKSLEVILIKEGKYDSPKFPANNLQMSESASSGGLPTLSFDAPIVSKKK